MNGIICHINWRDIISVKTEERGFVIISVEDSEGLMKGDRISGDFEICSDCHYINHTRNTTFNGVVLNNYCSEGQARKSVFPKIKFKPCLYDEFAWETEMMLRFMRRKTGW